MKLLVFLAFYFDFPVWNFHWKVYVFPDEKAGTIYINDEEGLTGEVEKCFGGWICIRPLLPGSSLLNLSSAGRSRVFSPALIYSAMPVLASLLYSASVELVCVICAALPEQSAQVEEMVEQPTARPRAYSRGEKSWGRQLSVY